MKKKEKTQIRNLGPQELTKQLAATESEILTLSVKRFTEQTKNTRAIKSLRQKRALIHTIVTERKAKGETA